RDRKRAGGGYGLPEQRAASRKMSASLTVDAFGRYGPPLLQVEPILVDRPTAGGRSRILNDQDLAARLGVEFVFIVRIRMKNHRPGPALPATDLKRSLEHVPDLREVVVVQRMMGSRLEAQNARVRLGGPFLPG